MGFGYRVCIAIGLVCQPAAKKSRSERAWGAYEFGWACLCHCVGFTVYWTILVWRFPFSQLIKSFVWNLGFGPTELKKRLLLITNKPQL